MREDIKSIADLRFDPNNANLGTDRGRKLLVESLEKYGAGRSIVCDRNGVVIGGNKTLEAAINLGLDIATVKTSGDKLVVVIRDDLDLESNPKARELAYYDNRVAEVDLQWNIEQLQIDLSDGIDLGSLWAEDELSSLQVATSPQEEQLNTEGIDDAPAPDEVEPRCKLGEIWQLGKHRMLCGDSTDEQQLRRLLGDRKVDMVWADPPYGINIVAANVTVGGGEAYEIPFGGVKNRKGYVGGGNCNKTPIAVCQERKRKKEGLGSPNGAKPFGSKDVRGSDRASNVVKVNKYFPIAGDDSIETAIASVELCTKLFPDAIHFWWGGNYYAHVLPPSSCWIVWDKENTGNFADAELAWTNHKSAVRIFRHMWNGMLKDSEHGESRVHPTQKPIALAEWAFDKYGSGNDVIFDPFLGSGISIIAAQKMEGNRTLYGMELSPQYCDATITRWEKLTGNIAQKL